ncbi:hypothetical protein [Rhizobium sp. SSA_523]|uniref:DUF5983 family protein n=1 Tax=Rhizobium sp. SSA_523 TaxID=2952477 RepID=UPI002091C5D3|nr:hypothetical protein [Rhizobium sp. SSA_523]MCO5730112.1 hypothetical protein [Rhizobium sp. SSA_523]WKC25177.1 hypothetical protein QTJ18_14410 [Rhizobium sp. SSA_523]
MTVRTFLDVSTAHLSSTARSWLSESATANHAASYHGTGSGAPLGCLGATLYGWFMSAPALPGHPDYCDHGIPEDMHPVIQHAHAVGCDYILFDADAPVINALPVFDEDG